MPKKVTQKKVSTPSSVQQNPRIIAWDLETTNLNADFGYLLCFGYKVLGEKKSHVISIDDFPEFKKDPTNDYFLVKKASEILMEADGYVTWYGSRFDFPYLQTRLLGHGLPILPTTIPHIDGWWIARKKMKLHSNRLASVTAFLGQEDKTPLSGPIWVKAAAGHRDSIKYIKEHCYQDVQVLEQVYERIKPLYNTHPNVALMANKTFGCPVCGSTNVQKRGVHRSRVATRQRYQCKDCNAWSSGGSVLFKTDLR